MPFGLQLIGRLHGDAQLLGAAQALEQACQSTPGLGRPKPDIDALRMARPELKSIVTHPPQTNGPNHASDGMTAV